MSNIEKLVPSLELCRKLKEAGFPQGGGGFYWRKHKGDKWELEYHFNNAELRRLIMQGVAIKAPVADEIISECPHCVMVDDEIEVGGRIRVCLGIEGLDGSKLCGGYVDHGWDSNSYVVMYEAGGLAELLAKIYMWVKRVKPAPCSKMMEEPQ